ncbi:MAG: toprim domain-containing protein, partial [Solimonas sp.]
MSDNKFVEGEPQALPLRRINQETAKHFNYLIGEFGGEKAQVANYYDPETRELVAQKVRQKPGADGKKRFKVLGDIKRAGLYGQHLWRDGGKMVVVTEGEVDALTVSQLQANKWPVVSVPNGAQSAKAAIAAQLPWLLKFDTVVLMFDDDEPGRGAAAECAQVLPVGRCRIATIHGFK